MTRESGPQDTAFVVIALATAISGPAKDAARKGAIRSGRRLAAKPRKRLAPPSDDRDRP